MHFSDQQSTRKHPNTHQCESQQALLSSVRLPVCRRAEACDPSSVSDSALQRTIFLFEIALQDVAGGGEAFSVEHLSMSGVQFREATPEDDNTVAEFFVKMWLDIGVPQDCLDPKKLQQTLDFIEEARSYDLKIYIAQHNGKPIGSASGHLFHGLYPDVINKHRSR